MSKYIDAKKLIAEINGIIAAVKVKKNPDEFGSIEQCMAAAEIEALNLALDCIKELQQEQPMPDSTKLIELWHEDKEMLKEKDFRDDPWRLAYNAFMCGFGRGIAVNKQEQPEVDLEKEIDKYFSRWMQGASDEGCFNANSQLVDIYDCHRIARHFFELGRNARKEIVL